MICETGGSSHFEGSRFLFQQRPLITLNSLLPSVSIYHRVLVFLLHWYELKMTQTFLQDMVHSVTFLFLSVKLIEKLIMQRFDLHTEHNGSYRSSFWRCSEDSLQLRALLLSSSRKYFWNTWLQMSTDATRYLVPVFLSFPYKCYQD